MKRLILLFSTVILSVIITPAQDKPICVVGRTLCAGNVGNVTPPTTEGYGTIEANGSPTTQRNILNFIAGANMSISCADNAGALTTNCTFVATGGGGGGGGTPGGAPGQLQWNSAGNFGGLADLTFNGAHTIALGPLGILDLHNAATNGILFPSAFSNGILRVNSGTGVITSSELSGDATTFGTNLVAVTHVLGVAYPGTNPVNSVNVGVATDQLNARVVPTCGDTTHALSFDGVTHTFGCQGISGTTAGAGGSTTQLQYNSSGVLAGIADLTFNGTHTIGLGVAGILDLHLAVTAGFFLPGTLSSGLVRVTTSTGAITSAEISGDGVTSGSNILTVQKVNGVAYATGPSTNTLPVITASNVATYTAMPNCGDSTHALAYDTTTHLFSCQTITTATAYNTVDSNGSAVTQRQIINFISGTNSTITCIDNAGAVRTDCTVSTPTAAAYATIDSNGTPVTQRNIVNFISGTNATVACVDNGGTLATDCTVSASSSAGTQLDQITAATGANSINNADNAQVWNWSLTTNGKFAYTIGENVASTATSSVLLDVQTLATSTAIPFRTTARGTTDGVELTVAGVLHAIGAGHINADQINGTAFSGTNGDLVCFGAANIPADCGFLATNVVRKDAANTGATAMTLDMTASTTANALRMPVGAGLTAGADGVIAYDSTAKITHVRTNGADSGIITATSTSTTTTQVLHATAVAGIGVFSAISAGDLPGSGSVTINGQTCTLNSTCNVNSGAAAHSVALNQGNGSAITGAAIGTAGRLLIDQGAAADPSFNAVSGDTSITNAGVMTVSKVNGVSYGSAPATNTSVIITASNTATYTAVPNCGDSSHALAFSTSTHLYSCQAISTGSATAGGSPGQLQWNNATALDGTAQWTTNGTTIADTASGVLDLHLSGTGGFFFPGAHASGIVKLTTSTGAMTTVAAPTGAIVGTTDTQTLTNKSISGSQINSGVVGAQFGGTGANLSATAGIVRAGNPFTVAELSGDCATSGSNFVTCTGINGATIPLSALFVGTNASRQFTALTATTATAALNLFSSTLQGLVPFSGGGTTNFLRADGTWAVPPGSGPGGSAFNTITGGTNTTAAMIVGSGATLTTTGNGVITASSMLGVTNALAPVSAGGCGMTFTGTDETSLLQACINATSGSGRTIWFPVGVTLISDTILWNKDNVTFMGSGGFTDTGLCYPGSTPGACLGSTIFRATTGMATKVMFNIDGTGTTRGFVNAPSMFNVNMDGNNIAAGIVKLKYVNGGIISGFSFTDWTSNSVYGLDITQTNTSAVGTCGNGGGRFIVQNGNIQSYRSASTGGMRLGDPSFTSTDVCSIKVDNVFIAGNNTPGTHLLWVANSDSNQFSNMSLEGFTGIGGTNTMSVTGGVGTLTVASHNVPSSGPGSTNNGIYLVFVCTSNNFDGNNHCTSPAVEVPGAEGPLTAAYASATTLTITGLYGVANGTYFIRGIHGTDLELGTIETTNQFSLMTIYYGVHNPGNSFNFISGYNWGEVNGQNPTYSRPGGNSFPVIGTDGSQWNMSFRNLVTFQPIGDFPNNFLTFSSSRATNGVVPDFYQVIDLTALAPTSSAGYYGLMLANGSAIGAARNGGGQLSMLSIDSSNILNLGTAGTFGSLSIGQSSLTTRVAGTLSLPNYAASLCLATNSSSVVITQACGGGSNAWSALTASTNTNTGTFAVNSAAVFTFAGSAGNTGKIQITTDFNSSSAGAAGIFMNLVMPTIRGTGDYYGIRMNTADTIGNSSPFIVTNTGNGDSYYAGNQGSGSGNLSSTSYATDVNYSTAGFIATGGALPCTVNSGAGVGSGCELTNNSSLTTRGLIIYDWSWSASSELALEVANASGGVNAVARFANFGDNHMNLRFYAGKTSQQEEGICYDRYDTIVSPCLWFLGSTASGTVTQTPFHLEDRLNSRTLLSATTGSTSRIMLDQGLQLPNGSGALKILDSGGTAVNVLSVSVLSGNSQTNFGSQSGGFQWFTALGLKASLSNAGTFDAVGFSVGGTAGFTGNKVAGSCTINVVNGLVTNITGC
jgi:hypothetical protein